MRAGDKFRAFEFHPRELQQRRGEAGEFTGGSGEYPLAARYGFTWVWYGNPDNADPDLIPDIPFLSPRRATPAYARVTNFFHSSYELVLENILDLTDAATTPWWSGSNRVILPISRISPRRPISVKYSRSSGSTKGLEQGYSRHTSDGYGQVAWPDLTTVMLAPGRPQQTIVERNGLAAG